LFIGGIERAACLAAALCIFQACAAFIAKAAIVAVSGITLWTVNHSSLEESIAFDAKQHSQPCHYRAERNTQEEAALPRDGGH
jgi:hypothetical protein